MVLHFAAQKYSTRVAVHFNCNERNPSTKLTLLKTFFRRKSSEGHVKKVEQALSIQSNFVGLS
jgi:hypothetical protein